MWFPAGPLNFSSNFPSTEATLLPDNWQEKISLLLRCTRGWIRIAQKRQKSMCFIAPTTTTHTPVPKRRSSRTGGCLNFTPNSPKSNTTDSIQKAAKLWASDQRWSSWKATLKCNAPPEARRKWELKWIPQVLQTDCWLARSPGKGAQRCRFCLQTSAVSRLYLQRFLDSVPSHLQLF